jgi:hypothetical protein
MNGLSLGKPKGNTFMENLELQWQQPLHAVLAAETVLSSKVLYKLENDGGVIRSQDSIFTNYAVCPQNVLRNSPH